jgi:hypothetical protein
MWSLPRDVSECIFGLLDPASLASLACTSGALRHATTAYRCERGIRVLEKHTHALRSPKWGGLVSLEVFRRTQWTSASVACVPVPTPMPHLRRLTLKHCKPGAHFWEFVDNAPGLESLDVDFGSVTWDAWMQMDQLSRLRGLKTLKLHVKNRLPAKHSLAFPRLERLELLGCPHFAVSAPGLIDAVVHEGAELDGCEHVHSLAWTGSRLPAYVPEMRELRTLDLTLTHAAPFNIAAFLDALSHVPAGLTCLEVRIHPDTRLHSLHSFSSVSFADTPLAHLAHLTTLSVVLDVPLPGCRDLVERLLGARPGALKTARVQAEGPATAWHDLTLQEYDVQDTDPDSEEYQQVVQERDAIRALTRLPTGVVDRAAANFPHTSLIILGFQ